jgi:hypothetical protein
MVSVCREIEAEAANGSAAELTELLEILQARFEEVTVLLKQCT